MAYLFALISAVGYGLNIFFLQMGMRSGKANNNQALLINLLSGTVFLGLIGLTNLLLQGPVTYDLKGLIYYAAAGLTAPFLGRLFNIGSIKKIGGTRTSILRMSEVFLTILLSIFILGERISLTSSIGAGILILGLFILIKERRTALSPERVNKDIKLFSWQDPKRDLSRYGYVFLSSLFFAFGKIFNRYGLDYMPNPILGALCGTSVALLTNTLWMTRGGIKKASWKIPLRDVENINKKVLISITIVLTGVAVIVLA